MPIADFTGCGTALVTPFHPDGSLDETTFRSLVKRQIADGISYLVPCGTTGEVPTLTHDEHLRVVEIALEEAKGRVPVLAGCGGNDTAKIIATAKELESMKVDGLLSVTPYYNKPNQEGVYQHFAAVARATSLPIIVYSVQPRTNVNVEADTMRRLSEIDTIIGVKEASGSVAQVAAIVHKVKPSFLVLSGDDAVTLPVISLGGHGIISVVSNEIPGPMTKLAKAGLAGDYTTARAIQRQYFALFEGNFIEPNPAPAKWVMERMGLCGATCRLPIAALSEASKAKLSAIMQEVGLPCNAN